MESKEGADVKAGEGRAERVHVVQSSSRQWALPFGHPVYDRDEIGAVSEAMYAGHIATGEIVARFEDRFRELLGYGHAIACCSGSMANFLAVAIVKESGQARSGDRVVVSGATFITAIAPVVQHGLVPVFVDLAPGGVNIDLHQVERAIAEHGAVGAILPHTLGQPLDLDAMAALKKRRSVWLIEDCCESLGASWRGRPIGTVGDMATFSFYAGHHLSTGEGGMLVTAHEELAHLARSLRAFGRDVSFQGPRMSYDVGDRPIAPEERYIHTRLGYNAKLSDLQAAMGIVQLGRLATVVRDRRRLAGEMVGIIRGAAGVDILGDPVAEGASPFGVTLRLRSAARRAAFGEVLQAEGVEVRGFLGASSAHQPCFDTVEKIIHDPYEHAPSVGVTSFILGCPPGLDERRALSALQAACDRWNRDGGAR